MAVRNIFIVNATQVVTSDSNPQGLFSTVTGYPKTFDSKTYEEQYASDSNPDGAVEKALLVAKSDYYSRLSANYASDTRAMWTVTLEMANGQQIMKDTWGSFPVVTPVQPEPEPEPENPEEPTEPEGE